MNLRLETSRLLLYGMGWLGAQGKEARHAVASRIYSGTSEIQRETVARAMGL